MDDQSRLWRCRRWVIGDLVIEHRYCTPRRLPTDSPEERRAKEKIMRGIQSEVSRNQKERIAMYLAALGPDAEHYQLTFSPAFLPASYRDFCRLMENFFARVRRALGEMPLDYVIALEGLHGDHRYHVHFCCPAGVFTQETLSELWCYGFVLEPTPVLKTWVIERGRRVCLRTYHDLAGYFLKERQDGAKFPVGCHPCRAAMHLIRSIPPPATWVDVSGEIPIPSDAKHIRQDHRENRFGGYSYASYINARARTRACNTIL